jgi:hypothetical protein
MSQQRRDYVGVRVDRAALVIVRRVAQLERRSISGVIRNVLADWAEMQAHRLRLMPPDRNEAA